MTLEPPPALVAYIGDFAADAKQYICNSAGPVGYGSRRMPSNKWVLVALLSLVAGGAYAQSNRISCTPNTGYPWPSGGCLNLTDLNAAFAAMGTLTPLSGGWAPQATGPAVFRS